MGSSDSIATQHLRLKLLVVRIRIELTTLVKERVSPYYATTAQPDLERKTRLELATTSLEGWSSTN
jgi:hypothetical protein